MIIFKEDKENEKEDEKPLAPIEYSRYVGITQKSNVDFPVKIKNLFKEHFSNPWKQYKDLGTIGEGSFGVVKKVCLKNHEETIRAMKIIPKKYVIEDENGKKLVD